jgi:hypothetical protein
VVDPPLLRSFFDCFQTVLQPAPCGNVFNRPPEQSCYPLSRCCRVGLLLPLASHVTPFKTNHQYFCSSHCVFDIYRALSAADANRPRLYPHM